MGYVRRLRRRVAAGAGLGVVAALGTTGTAQADVDVITVDSAADPGDGDCATDGCTLREAILETDDGDSDRDRILFAASLSGATITLDGTQLPILDETLRIEGPGSGALNVDGVDTSRILYVDAGKLEPVTVSGLTLANGTALTGGALAAFNSDLTLVDTVITGSEASTTVGGGIYHYGGSLTLRDSTVSTNTAAGSGGGLNFRVDSTPEPQEKLVVTDSQVSGNTSTSGDGGGIYTRNAPSLVEGTALSQNHALAGSGGGQHSAHPTGTAPVTATFSDSTVSGNDAAVYGGGISAQEAVTVVRSTLSGNTANGGGGGLSGQYTDIDASTISGNDVLTGGYGGGVRSRYTEIRRSTVSGNSIIGAIANGAGISADATLTLESSTVSGNTAEEPTSKGGGVYSSAGYTPTIVSSIIANNSAGAGPDLYGVPFQAEFTIVEDGAGATINETVAISNLVGLDPELGPLADNGGPTMTHLPGRESPAIDFGFSDGSESDQRGLPRPVDLAGFPNSFGVGGDASDMGAVEMTPEESFGPSFCGGKQATIVQRSGRRLNGTAGPDVIVGNQALNIIRSGGGKDIICGLGGNDKLFGGPGRDRIFGGPGKDRLFGGPGKDVLRGGRGKDRLKQ